jgi:light-regulated signal transduction histidine kinase (bacteriophytochrome)
MILRSNWRPGPSQLDISTAAATSRMTVSAETLVSHLEILRAERVGALTPEQLRFVETAERQGLRLLRLIQDLRTVALAESAALELEWVTCDLGDIAYRATDRIAAAAFARRKPIELAVDAPARVLADRERLERALLGLFEHAVEESDAGNPIAVEVRPGEIEVRYLAETFDRESLGLSLADAVATLHGGSLTAATEAGEVRLVLALGAEATTDSGAEPLVA